MTEKVMVENLRAKELKKFIEEKDIKGFQLLEGKEEGQPTILQSYLGVKEQNLPMIIVTDDTVYTMIQIQVATAVVNDENRVKLLELLNGYNLQFRMLKYSISDDGNIILTCSIPSSNDHFEPAIVIVMIDQMKVHLDEVYSTVMSKVWEK